MHFAPRRAVGAATFGSEMYKLQFAERSSATAREMGQAAVVVLLMAQDEVEILLRKAAQPGGWAPEHRLFEVKLVERQSCRFLQGRPKGKSHGTD